MGGVKNEAFFLSFEDFVSPVSQDKAQNKVKLLWVFCRLTSFKHFSVI